MLPEIFVVGSPVTFTFDDGDPGKVCDFGSAPAAKQWDVLFVNSDTTVVTPSGFDLLVSRVGGQGAYIYVRQSTGTEGQTVTIDTNGNNNTVVSWARLKNVKRIFNGVQDGSGGSGTATPAKPVGIAVRSRIGLLAFGALHGFATTPTDYTWTANYNQIASGNFDLGAGGIAHSVATNFNPGANEAPVLSWTNSVTDRYILMVQVEAELSHLWQFDSSGVMGAPALESSNGGNSLTLANWFTTKWAGYIHAISFWAHSVPGSSNYTVELWQGNSSVSGTLLASKTIPIGNVIAGDWNTVYLDNPVLIKGDRAYAAAVYSPEGKFVLNEHVMNDPPIPFPADPNNPLVMFESGSSLPNNFRDLWTVENGTYEDNQPAGTYPNTTPFDGQYYWLDVIFEPRYYTGWRDSQEANVNNANDGGAAGITTASGVIYADGYVWGIHFLATETVSGQYIFQIRRATTLDNINSTSDVVATRTINFGDPDYPEAGFWNYVFFPSPIAVNSTDVYVACAWNGDGRYVATNSGLADYVGSLDGQYIWEDAEILSSVRPGWTTPVNNGRFRANSVIDSPNSSFSGSSYFVESLWVPLQSAEVVATAPSATFEAQGEVLPNGGDVSVGIVFTVDANGLAPHSGSVELELVLDVTADSGDVVSIQKSLEVKYQTKAAVQKSLGVQYQVKSTVQKSLAVQYQVRRRVSPGRVLSLKYGVRKRVFKSFSPRYSVRVFVASPKSVAVQYGVRQRVQKTLAIEYDTQVIGTTTVTKTLVIRYHTLSSAGQTVGRPIAETWTGTDSTNPVTETWTGVGSNDVATESFAAVSTSQIVVSPL